MYDKELIDSVCNLTCDFDSLNRSQTQIKYDGSIYAFDKYYNFELIVKAMGLFEAGEITNKNLANWMCIYNWIINGGFGKGYNKRYKHNTSAKELIEWEISDWLDSLSFFDWHSGEDDIDILKDAKNCLAVLDEIWQHTDCYNEVYAYRDDSHGGDDSVFLIINRDGKNYILLGTEIDFDDIIGSPHIKTVEESKFDMIQAELTAAGYKKKYWPE